MHRAFGEPPLVSFGGVFLGAMKWEYQFFAVTTGQPQVESSVNGLGGVVGLVGN